MLLSEKTGYQTLYTELICVLALYVWVCGCKQEDLQAVAR